jgi:hypothetical protein
LLPTANEKLPAAQELTLWSRNVLAKKAPQHEGEVSLFPCFQLAGEPGGLVAINLV